jgi:ADP-ribose pyrophosphatase YjhB (NUDIX family)
MKKSALNIIINEKGETLFLLRAKKPFGWGLVGGKLDEGEDAVTACLRETFEETGIKLEASQIRLVGADVSANGTSLTVFETILDHTPEVKISKGEHLSARWIKTHRSKYSHDYTDEVRSKVFAGRALDILDKDKEIFVPDFQSRY